MSREKWLEERRKGIGGSDTAAILGLSAYATPYTVWADKTGRLPDTEDNEAMRQGRDLEAYVAQRFAERSGKSVHRVNAILQNSAYPWAQANIDRAIVGEISGLECKTTNALNMRRFRDGEFPENYYTQSVHYLAVTEYQRWYVAVLILSRDFLIYQMTRIPDDPKPEWCESSVYVSDQEIQALMEAEQAFWRYVEVDEPPAFSGGKPESEALAKIYQGGDAEVADLSGNQDKIAAYLTARQTLSKLEKEVAQFEQEFKSALGNCETGICGAYTINWRPQCRRTFDAKRYASEHPEADLDGYYKSTSYRKFEVKELRM